MLLTRIDPRVRVALALSFAAACSGSGNDGLGQSLGADDKDAAVEEDATAEEPDAGEPELDASEPDAAEPEVDAGRPVLTVRVRRGLSEPLADAIVVLHDAQGAVLGEPLVTGAAGEVTSDVAPAFVTVVPPQPALDTSPNARSTELELFTYTGVAAGDTLTVELPRPSGVRGLDVSSHYDVTLPTLPAQLPTRSYSLELTDPSPSCAYRNLPDLSQLPAPLLVPVALGCELPASGNTLVAKFTDDIGSAAWYAWASDLGAPPRDGTLPVTLGSWVTPTFSELRLTGYTSQNDAIIDGQIAALLADGRTVDGVLAYDQSFDLLFGTDFGVPEGLGDALHAEVVISGSIDVGAQLFRDRRAVVARRVQPGTPAVIDYADVLDLPHSAQLSGEDSLRPTLSFTPPARLDGVDALIGHLYLQFNDGVQYRSARWAFMLPPDAEQVVVPALPADLAGYVGAGASQTLPFNRFVGVAAVGDDVSSDFIAFRARPVRLLGEQASLGDPPLRVDVSDCGQFAMTSWFEPLE